jgi:hypothetical protein
MNGILTHVQFVGVGVSMINSNLVAEDECPAHPSACREQAGGTR